MIYYTYLAIHKATGYFYYGARCGNKLPPHQDLGRVYFTSSKTVKTIVEIEGPEAFHWIVRKHFTTKEETFRWEYKVIRRMLKHNRILNKALTPKFVPGNWYTNGKDNILGKYCPIGYWPGRTMEMTDAKLKSIKEQKKRKWWNNGLIEIHCEFPPNSNWSQGRLKGSLATWNGSILKNKLWWNNGVENIRSEICPGPEFIAGRLKFTTTKKRAPKTESERITQSEAIKGRKWWNDGNIELMSKVSPGDTFVLGRLESSKNAMKVKKTKHSSDI